MAAAAATPIVGNRLFVDSSDLDIDPSPRIISLSDIHGDMDALIIALRDCAKVIEPISGIPSIGNNVRDSELDRFLNLDLMVLSNMILFDNAIKDVLGTDSLGNTIYGDRVLNFRWIGGNTHVVLVGDIIDPVRKDGRGILQTSPLPGKRNANDLYPQAEIKILKFLNRLDELANANGGKVIKLIGNHEIGNFKEKTPYSPYYGDIYTHDGKEPMPYINQMGVIDTLPRNVFFNLNQPGFHLFMERGSGVYLRINNILFMHGQLYNPTKRDFNYTKCDRINSELNQKPLTINSSSPNFTEFMGAPQLWDREYGDETKIHVRMNNPLNGETFCKRVVDDVTVFLGGHPIMKKIPADKFKIIIGHCPQMYSVYPDNLPYPIKLNRTFYTQNQLDEKTVELTQPAKTFLPEPMQINTNNVFGISMECPTQPGISTTDDSDQHHRIYKVDVGVSRGFEQNAIYNMTKSHQEIKQLFLSRVPQVLELHGDNVRILRSTVKNTRIHQFRQGLEDQLSRLPNPQDFTIQNMTYGGYKQKYLKYKQKYLELKQKLNM